MLSDIPSILFGAVLVSVGFLVAALAERIRGARGVLKLTERDDIMIERPSRPRAPRETDTRQFQEMPYTPAFAQVPRAEPKSPATRAETKNTTIRAEAKSQATRAETTPSSDPGPGSEVITALMTAGYKRNVATTATWACAAAERATIEGWVAAALRRCVAP